MLHIERFQVNMLQENCYVVSDETKECVIIDCGAFYPEERTAIVNYIKENELKPVHLLVTHGHLDHNPDPRTLTWLCHLLLCRGEGCLHGRHTFPWFHRKNRLQRRFNVPDYQQLTLLGSTARRGEGIARTRTGYEHWRGVGAQSLHG
mgnify:CR=1 FL=1